MGFKVDHIKTSGKNSEGSVSSFLNKDIALFGKTFSNKKREYLYTELGVLLEAGVSLKEALQLLEENYKKDDKKLISKLLNAIIHGESFFSAMKQSHLFSNYEYFSVKIGEETGTLARVMKELGLFYQRKNEHKKNIIQALTYPLILIMTAFGTVFFMLKFVVPMFADIYAQNDAKLPWLTELIVQASTTLENYFWIILLMLAALAICLKLIAKKSWYQKHKSAFILKVPIIGDFIKKIYLAQFTQAVALLTLSKVPMLNSIQIAKEMIMFYPLKTALEAVEAKVLLGDSLSESMASQKLFEDKMITLIRVAEETNKTEFIFERLTKQYSEEIQSKSKTLNTVLEPLIILFLGVVIGLILIGMYLPMFELSSVIG